MSKVSDVGSGFWNINSVACVTPEYIYLCVYTKVVKSRAGGRLIRASVIGGFMCGGCRWGKSGSGGENVWYVNKK